MRASTFYITAHFCTSVSVRRSRSGVPSASFVRSFVRSIWVGLGWCLYCIDVRYGRAGTGGLHRYYCPAARDLGPVIFGTYLHFLYTYERACVLTRLYRLTATALNAAYVPCGIECSAARLDSTGLDSSSGFPSRVPSERVCKRVGGVLVLEGIVTGERTCGGRR